MSTYTLFHHYCREDTPSIQFGQSGTSHTSLSLRDNPSDLYGGITLFFDSVATTRDFLRQAAALLDELPEGEDE